MKRILSLVLCLLMVMSLGLCVNAAGFNDLAENHWAYKNIMTLVNEGTINGYDDGTFKPAKSVTRAEFVKMIGKWDQKHDGEYEDLSTNHWAYEYIMWSGLDSVGTVIRPDEAIKRSDVINLIWKRNGSPKHDLAPKAISNQGTNSDATSWAYTIGLMKGDDGLNLRLDSSLTRAEAAALIVRSREMVSLNAKNNFIDVVSEDILGATYESLNLLGDAYNADKAVTYSEIARMAIAIGADGTDIVFTGGDLLDSKKNEMVPLGHDYDNEMFVLSTKVWGENYYKLEIFDKPVTKQDAISAIVYGFVRRGTIPSTFGKRNDFYPDCKDANSTSLENMCLTFAKTNGIKLNASENIGANENITVKELAAILVQLNETIGLSVKYVNGEKDNAKIITNMASIPANYKDFKATIKDAPIGIYNLKKNGVSAAKSYKSISALSFVYSAYLSEIANLTKKNTGYSIDYTFYPTLSYKQDGNVLFAAKFVVNKNGNDIETVSVDKLFGYVLKQPTGLEINTGGEVYVVFETYGPLMDVYLPVSGAYAKAVFVK